MKKQKAKVLLFDIETAPSLGWFWQMYDTNIIEVKEHGYMLSFSAKWLGESKVYTYSLADFSGHKAWSTNDKKLVQKLSEMIAEADIVVAHNGDRFDIPTTNTRLIVNGFKPLTPTRTVDTLKVARSKFNFLSNRLDDLGNFLGVGRKLPHTGKNLWFKCMANDASAWKTMRRYNEQDVRLLEAVYLKLRPWMTNHPNLNIYNQTDCSCRACGSSRIQRRGYDYTNVSVRQKFVCLDCGAWSRGKSKTIKELIVR